MRSERTFSETALFTQRQGRAFEELREYGVLRCFRVRLFSLRNSQHEQANPSQAALKNTMADAPTTTKTKTSIKMAGSTTIRSALPEVVACISRMPTVAK